MPSPNPPETPASPHPSPARPRRRARIVFGIGAAALVGLVAAGLAVRAFVVPSLLVGAIQARTTGHVAVDSWWLGGSSAGLVGLTLHQGPSPDSPVVLHADRVATDLSIAGLLSGRWMPGKVALEGIDLALEFDRDGKPKLPEFDTGEGGGTIPAVEAREAKVTVRQEGRPEMALEGVSGWFDPEGDGYDFQFKARDRYWGDWTAEGVVPDVSGPGRVVLTSDGPAEVDPTKAERVPFVPVEVWENLVPRGPVAIRLEVELPADLTGPPPFRVILEPKGATFGLPPLGLTAVDVAGLARFEAGVLTLEGVSGRSLDGRVAFDGTLDFTAETPRMAVDLSLDGVQVAQAPPQWQLEELQATGSMSGKARLRIALAESGPDLTGSEGDATIVDGSIGGIPVKSLGLHMSAQGSDLIYDTPEPEAAATRPDLARWALPLLLAIQDPPAEPEARPDPQPEPEAKAAPRLRGLRPISTTLELEDVDLKVLLDRAEALAGITLPFPVAGKLSLNARATIPLTTLRDLRTYAFQGRATLSGASIAGVDLGRVDAALDLSEGVLTLTDFRGILVEDPEGDAEHPPEPADPVPAEGPLPPGGFRGTLRAELAPKGRLTARFEGERLPLGELAAPALPRPTPLAGYASLEVSAEADVEHLGEVRGWTGQGRLASERIAWRDNALSAVEARFALDGGIARVDIGSATIAGRPIEGTVWAEARWPEVADDPITGTIKLVGVDTAALAGLVPGGELQLEGKADGVVNVTAPTDGRSVSGDLRLSAPGLTVQGIPAEAVTADIRISGLALAYDLAAESLGGRVRFRGEVPLDPDAELPAADGELQATEVGIGPLLAALGVGGPAADLRGRAALLANVRLERGGAGGVAAGPGGVFARGVAEVRDLRYGPDWALGSARADVAVTPTRWRVDNIEGDILGGRATGSAWSEALDGDPGPGPALGFEVRLDRAPLGRLLAAIAPEVAPAVDGRASIRAGGRLAEAIRVNAELGVERGTAFGLPLVDLRVPVELTATPAGSGTARVRRWSGRIAGGRFSGEGRLDLAGARSYQATVQIADLDLETFTRLDPTTTRPASGRISGRVRVQGHDPSDLRHLRGRIDLTLVDAAVFSLPVFRDLARVIGFAGAGGSGGVFERGELTAAIANRQVVVEQLALAGPLAQLHAQGTVGFNGQLQLDVLLNTSQIIPQTGTALLAVIPGLGAAMGRGGEAAARVGSFLSNRLLKFRVTGTIWSPTINADPAVLVTQAAVGFFGSTLGLPLNILR